MSASLSVFGDLASMAVFTAAMNAFLSKVPGLLGVHRVDLRGLGLAGDVVGRGERGALRLLRLRRGGRVRLLGLGEALDVALHLARTPGPPPGCTPGGGTGGWSSLSAVSGAGGDRGRRRRRRHRRRRAPWPPAPRRRPGGFGAFAPRPCRAARPAWYRLGRRHRLLRRRRQLGPNPSWSPRAPRRVACWPRPRGRPGRRPPWSPSAPSRRSVDVRLVAADLDEGAVDVGDAASPDDLQPARPAARSPRSCPPPAAARAAPPPAGPDGSVARRRPARARSRGPAAACSRAMVGHSSEAATVRPAPSSSASSRCTGPSRGVVGGLASSSSSLLACALHGHAPGRARRCLGLASCRCTGRRLAHHPLGVVRGLDARTGRRGRSRVTPPPAGVPSTGPVRCCTTWVSSWASVVCPACDDGS